MNEELLRAIEQLKNGEEAGFNYIYAQTYKLVYFQARGHLKNEEDVQDLVQSVYIALYRNIHTLKDPEAFYGWLKTIVRNQAVMMLRKFKDEISLEEGMEEKQGVAQLASFDISTLPEANAEQKAVSEMVADIISELPELQKSALLMYYYENMKVEEIAEVMGCSAGTIKSRLNYARKQIGERVEAIEKRDGIRLHALAIPTLVFAFRMLAGREPKKAMAAMDMLGCIGAASEGTPLAASLASNASATAETLEIGASTPVATEVLASNASTPATVLGNGATSAGKISKGVFSELKALSGKAKAVMLAGTLVVSGGAVTTSNVVENYIERSADTEQTMSDGQQEQGGISSSGEGTSKQPEQETPGMTSTPGAMSTPVPTDAPTPTLVPTPTPYVMSEAEQKTFENLRYEIENGKVTILGLVEGVELTELVIPAQIEGYPVTRIGDKAFANCSELTRVVLPDSVIKMGEEVFSWCVKLQEVTLSKQLMSIPRETFRGCEALLTIELPESVLSIEGDAFYQAQLREIHFSSSLIYIADNAFEQQNTGGLSKGSGVMCFVTADKGSYAEKRCVELGWISEQRTTEEAPVFTYTVENGEVTITGMDKDTWDYLIIPELIDGYPVTRIGAEAFKDRDIRYVNIPAGVEIVEQDAFYTKGELGAVKFCGDDILFMGEPFRVRKTGFFPSCIWVKEGSLIEQWWNTHR